jgi:hypothetical protein
MREMYETRLIAKEKLAALLRENELQLLDEKAREKSQRIKLLRGKGEIGNLFVSSVYIRL